MKNLSFIMPLAISLMLHATSEADDVADFPDTHGSLEFSGIIEIAFKQEAAADFVTWYSTDGKLDIGIGRTNKKERIHYPIQFALEELEDFFDGQKHKDLIVAGIAKHVWTDDVLQWHISKLRDYFVARGHERIVIQQAYASGPGIHLDHVANQRRNKRMRAIEQSPVSDP